MKRIVYFLAILSITAFACSFTSTPTPPPPATTAPVTQAPVVTQVPAVSQPPAATASLPPAAPRPAAQQANTTCNELSFYLDPSLATGFNCTTVPEVNDQNGPGFDITPKYTKLTLTGYVLSDRFFEPQILVYPVQRFEQLMPDAIQAKVTDLQALIGGSPAGTKGLPLLPNFNAGQLFYAQYQVLGFVNGNGIRYLTQYAQFTDPINNHELFFTYQALTADGNYWVAAILPIMHPILPADGNNPPNGQTQDQFTSNYPAYITAITSQLNSESPGSFTPTLNALDALVSSIMIQP